MQLTLSWEVWGRHGDQRYQAQRDNAPSSALRRQSSCTRHSLHSDKLMFLAEAIGEEPVRTVDEKNLQIKIRDG